MRESESGIPFNFESLTYESRDCIKLEDLGFILKKDWEV
jgi:hypothetical protein